MKVVASAGREDIALVYIAQNGNDKFIEFVESVQPPFPREEKWVLIVSTLYGCPGRCRFCDCGGYYEKKLTTDEIFFQINYLIRSRYPDIKVPVKKFKIQFARMGEPSFNPNVLEVLYCLPEIYDAPGLMPCISTIAPNGTDWFFESLIEIKKEKYDRSFQLQFSIHTTDKKLRDWLIPVKKWDFERIADYGKAFYNNAGRKITLNFALADGMPVDTDVLLCYFSPNVFTIKLTPVNPTYRAISNKLSSALTSKKWNELVSSIRGAGYETILSIGEQEEDYIGSNCGQYISAYKAAQGINKSAYTYNLNIL